MRRLFLALALSMTSLGATAADAETEALLNEVRQIAEEARQRNAANQWLQHALDDLVMRYDSSWPIRLVFDNFRDGDYHRNPAWVVTHGRFGVDPATGLRSRVAKPVMGGWINPDSPALGKGDFNRIKLDSHISNAFALNTEFTLNRYQGPGRFVIGVVQDNPGRYGYRVRISGGDKGSIEMLRTSRHGRVSLGKVALPYPIDDGSPHRLHWHHSADDEIVVGLDGQRLFRVKDSSFRDDYQKLILRHNSGELVLRRIGIRGPS